MCIYPEDDPTIQGKLAACDLAVACGEKYEKIASIKKGKLEAIRVQANIGLSV